jgi:hypothetical protein
MDVEEPDGKQYILFLGWQSSQFRSANEIPMKPPI